MAWKERVKKETRSSKRKIKWVRRVEGRDENSQGGEERRLNQRGRLERR